MTPDVATIRNNPDFIALEAKRGRFGWTLTSIMLVIYYGFILLVAFGKDILSQKVIGVVTLAFPVGIGVILSAIVLTGIYVIRANGEFDRLTHRIRMAVLR